MNYITAETENMAQLYASKDSINWQTTNAKTLSAAKGVAQRNRMFQRTIAHVAYVSDSGIHLLASRIDVVWVDAE